MDVPTATTATSATWNFHGGRTITIEFENAPGYGFPRPTRIYGGAALILFPNRDRSLLPCTIPDAEVWADYKENSFEGGHILALSLGGPDHSLNIVPMNKGANCGSGAWGQIEGEIRRVLKANAPNALAIDLALSYTDMIDPHVPSRVRGTIGLQRIDLGIRPPTDCTNIVGRELKILFQDIEQEAGNHGLLSTSDAPHTPLDVIDRKTPISQALRNRLRQVPILAKYPKGGITRKSYKGKPSKEQRLLMMLYNRYRNKGLLMAEDPTNLGFMLNEWRVQADHIKPYSKNGNRQYRNLRLLHHRINNRRGAAGAGAGGKIKRVRKAPLRYGY